MLTTSIRSREPNAVDSQQAFSGVSQQGEGLLRSDQARLNDLRSSNAAAQHDALLGHPESTAAADNAELAALQHSIAAQSPVQASQAAVAKTAAWAKDDPHVQALTDDLIGATGGAPLPAAQQFVAAAKRAGGKDGTGGMPTDANVQALMMFVFMQAKRQMQIDKREALKKMQMYSAMLDAMAAHFNEKIMPAQTSLTASGARNPDKAATAQVYVDSFGAIDLDRAQPDGAGKVKLIRVPTYDGEGKLIAEHQQVTQGGLAAVIDNHKNITTQLQQRLQTAQTDYQGKDQQDATLANVLVAVLKTFNDSTASILRNGT